MKGHSRLDYTLDSDSEEENDIYDLVGHDVIECSHVSGPRAKGEFCHINEVQKSLHLNGATIIYHLHIQGFPYDSTRIL